MTDLPSRQHSVSTFARKALKVGLLLVAASLGMVLTYFILLSFILGEAMSGAAGSPPPPWNAADKARVLAFQNDALNNSGLVSPAPVFDDQLWTSRVVFSASNTGTSVTKRDVVHVAAAASKAGVDVHSCYPPVGEAAVSDCGLMMRVEDDVIMVEVGRVSDLDAK